MYGFVFTSSFSLLNHHNYRFSEQKGTLNNSEFDLGSESKKILNPYLKIDCDQKIVTDKWFRTPCGWNYEFKSSNFEQKPPLTVGGVAFFRAVDDFSGLIVFFCRFEDNRCIGCANSICAPPIASISGRRLSIFYLNHYSFPRKKYTY